MAMSNGTSEWTGNPSGLLEAYLVNVCLGVLHPDFRSTGGLEADFMSDDGLEADLVSN